VADLGEGPGAPPPPLFWVKKEEMTEGRKAGRASKSKPPPSPFSSKSGSATGKPKKLEDCPRNSVEKPCRRPCCFQKH